MALVNLHVSVDLWGIFFCLVAVISVLIGQRFDRQGSLRLIALMICAMLLLFSDVLASLYAGSAEENAFEIVRRATFWSYFFGFLILPLVAGYLTYLITVRTKIEGLLWKYVEWFVFFFGVIFTAINYDGGMFYRIDTIDSPREQLFSLFPGIILMFGLLISVGVVLEYLRFFIKTEKTAFISFLALPFLALFYWLFLGGPSLVILSVLISTLILYFSYEFNSREYRIELERNLADQQIRMFHHQIQPHFVFNSLAVIKYQCRKSPEEAIDTIDEFSDYLRDSTDLMTSMECVPVRRELDLVGHYINLQQRRFQNHFDYIEQIEDTDFEVPPFSIQTCVENAFTHGLQTKSGEGEFICVRTYQSRSSHVVEIEDNGAGFDVRILESLKGTNHVGITNTKERVQMMCGGTFRIESTPGKGTKVTITIPKSRKSHEDTDH